MVSSRFLLLPCPYWTAIFAIFRRTMRGRSPFSPDMEHFHHRLMAKGLSHGKAVLAMWAMAGSCSLVAIAAAFGKGDQLFAVFVFFGMGGFILLRYLGYFRFEFLGKVCPRSWMTVKAPNLSSSRSRKRSN